jgi:hypothetical protein
VTALARCLHHRPLQAYVAVVSTLTLVSSVLELRGVW